jgi:hypothetical protein
VVNQPGSLVKDPKILGTRCRNPYRMTNNILNNNVYEYEMMRYNKNEGLVIAQFVARLSGYEVEGQTGVTGTYPTQCHHNGEVLSL